MTWKPAPRALVLVLIVAFCLAAIGAQAQAGNLLTNPGFEPPFVDNGGQPPRLVAQGWAPWNLPAEEGMSFSQMLQPEYYPSNTAAGLGPARVRSGSESQRMQIFFGTFTAGVTQTVGNLTAGQTYTFGSYVWVWSSSFDDPNLSQQDGGVTVQVGVDPTGGTDPTSAAIVWSDFVAPKYDQWGFYSVSTAVTAPSASVWIRATVTTPVKNTVVFMDDAVLVQGTDAGVPTTAPATTVPATTVPPTTVPPTSAPPTVAPPTATPTITLTPSPYPTVNNTAFPGRTVYIVKQNDTVAIIATQYGTSIDAILAANNLSPEGLIFVGQSLIIPLPPNAPTNPQATLPPTGAPTTVPPTAVPPTSVPPTTVPVVPTAVPTAAPVQTYVVRPGDTLFGIALRFNTTVAALQRANNIANPNLIFVGQRLVIPPPGSTGAVPTAITVPSNNVPGSVITPTTVLRTHTVRPGDNLYSIAIRYNTTVAALVDVNDIANPNLIFVGEVLTIP